MNRLTHLTLGDERDESQPINLLIAMAFRSSDCSPCFEKVILLALFKTASL